MTIKITSATFSACVVGKDGIPDDTAVWLLGRIEGGDNGGGNYNINNANNNWAIRPDLPQAPETCRQVSAVRAGAKEPYSRPHAICVWRKTAAERNGRAGISAFVSFL